MTPCPKCDMIHTSPCHKKSGPKPGPRTSNVTIWPRVSPEFKERAEGHSGSMGEYIMELQRKVDEMEMVK